MPHGQRMLTVEVLDSEDVGTTFTGSSDNLGGMNLHESLRIEEVAEKLANSSLNTENGLVGDGLLKPREHRSGC